MFRLCIHMGTHFSENSFSVRILENNCYALSVYIVLQIFESA